MNTAVPQSSFCRPLLALWLNNAGPDLGFLKQVGAVHQVYSLSPHLPTFTRSVCMTCRHGCRSRPQAAFALLADPPVPLARYNSMHHIAQCSVNISDRLCWLAETCKILLSFFSKCCISCWWAAAAATAVMSHAVQSTCKWCEPWQHHAICLSALSEAHTEQSTNIGKTLSMVMASRLVASCPGLVLR